MNDSTAKTIFWKFNMHKFLSVTLLVFAFSSSVFAGPTEEAFKVVELWAKAFTAADVDAIVGIYAADAVFMGTGSKKIVTQPEGVRKYFEAALLGNKKFVASLPDSSVIALNDTTVVVTALDKLRATVDGKSEDLLGRVTFVLSKRASGWKIVHFHRSAMP
jgi:ketosteroid isomerase-like protein